jgi:hypothetical protein
LSKETELARAERIRAERDQEVSRYFIGEIGSLRSQLAKQAPQRVALPPHSTQPTKTDIGESVEPPAHPLPSATAAQDLNSQFLQRESSLVNNPQTKNDDPIEILRKLGKLVDELDIDQAVAVADKEVLPMLTRNSDRMDKHIASQLYGLLIDIKLRQARRIKSEPEKRACLAEAEWLIEKANNVL